MKLRKLIAVLVAALMVVGMMPLSVFAALGGGFLWTESEEPMLIEQILERDGFLDGIWYPWLDGGRCGHNLTANDLMAQYYNSPQNSEKFVDWNSVELDRLGADTIYQQIYNLKAMGYNMMAYAGSIYGEGVIYDANGDVLGIKQDYLDNARRLLDMCREIGMPVMWNVYFHSSTTATYYGIDGWNVICQMLGNNEIADHYAQRFVRPLCEMLAEYPDVVALVSIADEPENEINDAGIGDHFGNDRAMYGVNQDDMIYFMQQINEVVRDVLPDVARTVASCGKNKAIYRDFNLDLMGHHEYNNGANVSSVESLITDADAILTEYNIGGDVFYTEDEFLQKQITFRENMMAGGYKGGFQWCWMPGGVGTNDDENHHWAGYLLRDEKDTTSFRASVTTLRYYIEEYRAAYRGETIAVDAPVLYANAGDGRVLFSPSGRAVYITLQRSDDGGATWKTILDTVPQYQYVDEHLIGRYEDTTAPESGYCYRILATDGVDTVTSAANNVAGAEKKYNREYVEPVYQLGESYLRPTVSKSGAKLTSFTVEKNRPSKSGQNLIENGGFESADGQWNNAAFLQYAQVVEDATTPDGDHSLSFDTSATDGDGWYTFTVSGLKENTEYTFSSWLKGAYLADDNRGRASIGVLDPDSGNFMVYWDYYSSFQRASRDTQQLYPTAWDDEWHLRAVRFNSGNHTSVTIALYGYGSKMWVDGLALFESINGIKYENGESATALTSDRWEDLSATATNAVVDPEVNNAAYWHDAAGYKQGFVRAYDGQLQYMDSPDPCGVRYTKWMDVKKNTDYYVSFTVNVIAAGGGRVAILDASKELPNEVVSIDFSTTGTKTYRGRISTGAYDRLGLCVVDLGGYATIDNICFYEAGESISIPTESEFDGYITNGNFEVGTLNGWENLWGANTVTFVDGRNSLFAMKVEAGVYTHVRQRVKVEPNTDYIIEAWVKDASASALLVKNGGDTDNMGQAPMPGGSSWSKISLEFNSADQEYVYVSLMGTVADATYTVDDVKMYKKYSDEYIVNGHFEGGNADGWENLYDQNAITMAPGYNSAYAMSVVAGEWTHVRQTNVAVTPYTDYVVELWCKDAVNATLIIKNGDDSVDMTSQPLPGGSSWSRVVLEFHSGAYSTVIVSLMGAAADARYTVDNVTMSEKVAPDPSLGLVNGGFEDGEQGWSFGSGAYAIVTDAYEGRYALQLSNVSNWGEAAIQQMAVEPNSVYRITWWYKASAYAGVFNLIAMGSNGENLAKPIGDNFMYNYNGQWKQGSYWVNTGSSTMMTLKFTTEQGWFDGPIWIDAVEVTYEGEYVCDHDYILEITQWPTCSSNGVCIYTCDYCGHSYTEILPATDDHVYDHGCDAVCNVCGAYREVPGHWYDNACDAYCNRCGAYRVVGDHAYEVMWSEDATCGYDGCIIYECRWCGYELYETLPATGKHSYSGACDAYCNECGAYRVARAHTYDNACDAYCNVCWEYRYVAGHQSDTLSCQDGYCIWCGVWVPAAYDHEYSSDCDVDCNECGAQRVPMEDHYLNGTYPCRDIWCYYCEFYVEATEDHTFPGPCSEACAACGEPNDNAVPHQSDAVDCGNGHCILCGMLMPAVGHRYSANCDTTCNVCGYVRGQAAIFNGDFENGGDGWQFNSGSHAFVGDAHSGAYALQLTNPGLWAEAAVQTVDVEPDTWYTITWWSKAEGGTGTYNLYLMNASDFGNLQLSEDEAYRKNWMNGHTGDWHMHVVKVYTGDATGILVKISTESTNPGTILIDDMCIEGGALADHEYSFDCDTTCDVCGEETDASGHVYEDEYDIDCDVCGAIREADWALVFGGNSVSEDVSGLAFRFDAAVAGVTIAPGTTTMADYTNATLGGYRLLSMGAIATNGVGTTDIPVTYVFHHTPQSVSFAIRVIKIPTNQYNRVITTTPYFILEIDGVATTVYGGAQACSYNQGNR